MKLILVLLSLGLCHAQELPDHQVTSLSSWKASVFTLAASSTLDAASSWGLVEQNPILGRGTFGSRQVLIKGGITGGAILTEYLFVRKHPERKHVLTLLNFSASGVLVGVSIHNWRLH